MKVGLVIYGSLDIMTGGFLYDRMLVEYLRGKGVAVSVVSLPWRPYAQSLSDGFSPALRRRLASLRVDVLLQDELVHPSLFFLNERIRRNDSPPVISIVHHLRCCEARPAWRNRICRLVENRYLRSCDGFVFNCEETKREVEAVVGEERPHVVAPPGGDRLGEGVSEKDIRKRCIAQGPLRILFVGSLIPRKGLHTLLDAVSRMEGADWRLTVAGSTLADPPYAQAMMKHAARWDAEQRVHFLGEVADDTLRTLLADSHVLAMPSSYEGFGIVYLEAMGFGVAPIASAAGGARELITHGVDGFLVKPDDAESLTGIMRELFKDRKRLCEMSLAARARFSRHPSWRDSCENIHRFLLAWSS